MKKYLAILLSLALVFCFISCDGSTKTPDGSNGSSSGSVTAVPKDSNVPDKSKLKPLDGNGVSVISEISSALNRYRDFKLQADIHETTWYKIGGGQILEYYVGGKLIEQGISGSYSEKYDVVINDANQIDTSSIVINSSTNATTTIPSHTQIQFIFSSFVNCIYIITQLLYLQQ